MVYKPSWSGDYYVWPIVEFNGLCYHIHTAHDDGSPSVERRTEHRKLFCYLERKLPATVENVARNTEKMGNTLLA